MPEQSTDTVITPGTIEELDEDIGTAFEPLWRVLLHNDNTTPFEYVMNILCQLFSLSSELAEHVAWTAHSEGTAVVVIRPRSEAKKLITVAHGRARVDGFPLTFSMERD